MPEAGPATSRATIHATCVAVEGRAALIVGPSGAGKSDLALRVVTTAFHRQGRPLIGALVADDQVIVERHEDRLLARAPAALADLMEIRGVGVVVIATLATAEVSMIVDVTPGQSISRLPDPPETRELLGQKLPLLRLSAFEASAPAKLVMALLRH